MSYNWGPHYIVPSKSLKTYSGMVQLREKYDKDLLRKELGVLGLSGRVTRVSNPWYYREKGTDTWLKIGESEDENNNFAVSWDTRNLQDGQYEVYGLMHVFVEKDNTEAALARENVVEITIKN